MMRMVYRPLAPDAARSAYTARKRERGGAQLTAPRAVSIVAWHEAQCIPLIGNVMLRCAISAPLAPADAIPATPPGTLAASVAAGSAIGPGMPPSVLVAVAAL